MNHKLHNPSLVFNLLLLIFILVLLVISLQPGFRGGLFIIFVLVGIIMMQISIIANSYKSRMKKIASEFEDSSDSTTTQPLEAGASPEWYQIAQAFGLGLVFFVLVLFFGMYFGTTLFLGLLWFRQDRKVLSTTFILVIVLGLVIPYVYGKILNITLWIGIVPQLIPGWLGGSTLPPL